MLSDFFVKIDLFYPFFITSYPQIGDEQVSGLTNVSYPGSYIIRYQFLLCVTSKKS